MSFPNDLRRTMTDLTGKVMEQGKSLGAQAQWQVAIKKLQVEQAKRIHLLGKRTFEWYKSGSLTVAGQVPVEVITLCTEIDDVQRQLDEAQRKLEESKLQAKPLDTPDSTPGTVAPDIDEPGA